MIAIWFKFWRDQEAAWYAAQCDATTFMQWREQGIAGVPNIPGC